MKKRKIAGKEVSPIGMGCMGFSHGYGQIPTRDYSIQAIRNAYAHGCTFFDTAETYGDVLYYPGHNEEIVGEAVEPFREHIVLATKLHIHDEELVEGYDLYDLIRSHLDASLKRLRTSYVDVYYLHRVNEYVDNKEIARVMGDLIKEGLIRGWGISAVDIDTIREMHEITPLSAVQNLYNIMERDCEKEVLPYCVDHDITLVPFSPIASGFLSGHITSNTQFEKVDDVRNFVPQLTRENMERNRPVIDILQELAEEKNATPAQISLAWMLKKYPNVIPIPGSKNQQRIIENLDAWNVELSDAQLKELDERLDQIEIHGHRGIAETEHVSFRKHWDKEA